MKERKPGMAFFVTVILVVALLLSPGTFGPAVWLTSRGHLKAQTVERVYRPVLIAIAHGPDWLSQAAMWWALLGVPEGGRVVLSVETDHIANVFHFQ